MRKIIATLFLFTSLTSPVLAEETSSPSQTISFYVVSHSKIGKDYWAVTQDGSKSLWFKESDISGELLEENDAFKASFDENGKLLSVQKYNFR